MSPLRGFVKILTCIDGRRDTIRVFCDGKDAAARLLAGQASFKCTQPQLPG